MQNVRQFQALLLRVLPSPRRPSLVPTKTVKPHVLPTLADNSREELTSWKQISAYLGVSIRTAQNWEAEKGMPVRRLPGRRSRVSVSVTELEQWKAASFAKRSIWRFRGAARYSAALMAVLFVIGAFWWLRQTHAGQAGVPALFHLRGQTLDVADTYGRVIWSKHFDRPFFAPAYVKSARDTKLWFGDIDRDGQIEVLFPYHPDDRDRTGTALICFSQQGQERWRFVPGRAFSKGKVAYSEAFIITDFEVFPTRDYVHRVVVTSHHARRDPNQAVVLSHAGTVLGEYWHLGHLLQVAVSALESGSEQVVLGGLEQRRGTAVLVSLDTRWLGRCLDDAGNSGPPVQTCGVGRESEAFLFPRTCISRRLQTPNEVTSIQKIADGYKVRVTEAPGCDCTVDYDLNRQLRVTGVLFSEGLQRLHRQMTRDGELDHAFTSEERERLRTSANERAGVGG